MSEFQRENRYTVIKHNQLTDSQSGHLKDFLLGEGVPTVKSVVIESDWPEYEPVWSMIERRMSGKPEHVGVIVAKKWLEGAPRAVSLINGSDLPDSAYLYLAPPASSDLAEATLQILKEAKDIPDGLYARAKHLSVSAQSELAALREERDRLDASLSCMSGHVLAYKLSRQRLLGRARTRELHISDLQQRLADAERRNALVERYAVDVVECLWGLELPGSGNTRLMKLRKALEALKPTESGASE